MAAISIFRLQRKRTAFSMNNASLKHIDFYRYRVKVDELRGVKQAPQTEVQKSNFCKLSLFVL